MSFLHTHGPIKEQGWDGEEIGAILGAASTVSKVVSDAQVAVEADGASGCASGALGATSHERSGKRDPRHRCLLLAHFRAVGGYLIRPSERYRHVDRM